MVKPPGGYFVGDVQFALEIKPTQEDKEWWAKMFSDCDGLYVVSVMGPLRTRLLRDFRDYKALPHSMVGVFGGRRITPADVDWEGLSELVPLRCHRCGHKPYVDHPFAGNWTVHCTECYDGATDSSTRGEVESGTTREQAVSRWNETQTEKRPEKESEP